MDKLYTIKQVAKRFNVSTRTIYNWIDDERINAVKFMDRYRITEEEVQRIMKEGVK